MHIQLQDEEKGKLEVKLGENGTLHCLYRIVENAMKN
jgi:hypothetical protein